jgi:hypothetical protein
VTSRAAARSCFRIRSRWRTCATRRRRRRLRPRVRWLRCATYVALDRRTTYAEHSRRLSLACALRDELTPRPALRSRSRRRGPSQTRCRDGTSSGLRNVAGVTPRRSRRRTVAVARLRRDAEGRGGMP